MDLETEPILCKDGILMATARSRLQRKKDKRQRQSRDKSSNGWRLQSAAWPHGAPAAQNARRKIPGSQRLIPGLGPCHPVLSPNANPKRCKQLKQSHLRSLAKAGWANLIPNTQRPTLSRLPSHVRSMCCMISPFSDPSSCHSSRLLMEASLSLYSMQGGWPSRRRPRAATGPRVFKGRGGPGPGACGTPRRAR